MKIKLFFPLCLTLALIFTSCGLFDNQSKPKGYVRHCVRLLDKHALYVDSIQWQLTKDSVLIVAQSITTIEEARNLVSRAVKVAGGKHSHLEAPMEDTASYEEIAPELKLLEDSIVYVKLPAHMGVKIPDSLYVQSVLDFLLKHLDAKGIILDLRHNSGGNMYPMIAAVSPLLPDGVILRFKGRKPTMPIYLKSVLFYEGLSADAIEKIPSTTPIAILTDEWTASSGEATLLCFRGLDHARSFGCPTAGYASANIVKTLADGYSLVITTACDMARTGEVFCDDPINPDVLTEQPMEEALAWIRK